MSQSGSSVSGMTRDELLLRGSDWTLGCDSVILNRLKEFSENLGRRSQEISHDCDTLAQDVDTLGYQISNVTNQFLMLGNTLFVENCVQEFEECSVSNNEGPVQSVIVESKAEKEAALIERMKESIRIGVGIQRQRDEIKANGFEESYGSVDSRVSSGVNLAHLIGSSKFFSNRYCGLLDENRLRRPSKPESVMSGVSNYDSTSLIGQDSTLLSEPEVPMSPSPILSDETSYEPIAPSEVSESIVPGNQPPQEPSGMLSPHEAIKRSLEERLKRMNLNADLPREQANNFYSDQPQVPTPPSVGSNESSSSSDNISSNVIREQRVLQPRSPSPVEYRPPPVADLSDSDEDDMFASVADISAPTNLFDDFFKNQNIYQPVFPSVFQPPPFLSEPPDLKQGDDLDKPKENIEPISQEHNAASSAAQSSPIRNVMGADLLPATDDATAQSAVQTSLPQQPTTTTTRVRVLPDLQGPSRLLAPRIPTETKTVGEPEPTISKPQMQNRNIVTDPIVTPVTAPKIVKAQTSVPSAAAKLPPPRKKVSIFDSSDSDEDLFANFGQKKAPKTDLFASSEPVTTKVPTTYNHLRPPPVLDVSDSDDSDDDIFSSLQRKKASFVDRVSPPPVVGREQLGENPESTFSPTIYEPDRGAPSAQNVTKPSKPNSFPDDQGKKTDRLVEEPQLPAVISTAVSSAKAEAEAPDVMLPDKSSSGSTVSGSPLSGKQSSESIPSDTQYFTTETVVPPEPPVVLGRSSPSSSSGGSDIFDSTSYVPPSASDILPEDPVESIHRVAPPTKDTVFEVTSNSQRKPADLFSETAYSRQEPPPFVPDFKPDGGSEELYRPLKVKSIFESSDSDDDLFAGGSKRTKATATLIYNSPLPPREPPELPQTKANIPQHEQRRSRIDSSDSHEDIFKSVSKTSRPEIPSPVDVPSSVQVTKVEEMSYPINEGNLAQLSDVQDNLAMPKSTLISSKPKKPPAASIFESSDSDDDLFSPISKGKSAPSLKNFVQRSSAPAKSVEVSSTKSASLFGDSDGEEDSLFSATKKKAEKPAEVSAVEPSINSLDPSPVAAQAAVSDEKPENFSARQQAKILRQGSESKERLFGAVAKNLESILSAKLSSPPASPKKPISVSLTSPVSPTDSVSFEDNTTTENLLRCVTKDRPKIHHPRRPPSVVIRRQISRSSESGELPPESEELGYFV